MKKITAGLVLLGCSWIPAAIGNQYLNHFGSAYVKNIGQFSGNTEGFVAAQAGSLPISYINGDGALECHLLLRKEGRSWRTTGDINFSGASACPLLSGVVPIRAVEAFGEDICIGGDFTHLGGVSGLSYFACYSETLGWYQPNGIGNGPDNSVYAIDVNVGTMFLGGAFTTVNAGTMSAKHVVKTGGFAWEPLYTDAQNSDNGVSQTVVTVYSTTSFLVALTGLDTMTWNAAVPEWVSRGSHNGNVSQTRDVVINGSTLTVSTPGASTAAGDFAGSVSDFSLGDQEWSEFGLTLGVDTHWGQLAYGLGPLYSTGDFTAFDPNAKGLAWYNVNTWEAAPNHEQLGDLNTARPNDMQQGGNEFCLRNGAAPSDAATFWVKVVCYDNNQWAGDNQAPLSNTIQTIASYGNKIILGGDFNVAGDVNSPLVAKLNNSFKWKAISQLAWSGSGQGHVRHLQTYAGDLYASGLFDSANGAAVLGIAKYDGTDWSEVAPGLVGDNALMTDWNNLLIIKSASGFMAWDGNAISSLSGTPPTGFIADMTTYQGDLVVASFNAGAGRLDRYDGISWQPFSGTVSGVIQSIEAVGDDLYVGGDFTGACNTVDFIPAENIYLWNGSTCEMLGSGVTNSSSVVAVNDIAVYGSRVFITGRFDATGGISANSLAEWSGGSWKAIGAGLLDGFNAGTGHALWVKDHVLYVAGVFEQAGDVLAHHFAAVDLDAVFSDGFESL